MNGIILILALIVAAWHPARADTARVGGTVDCSSGFWCTTKDLAIVGTIDSSTLDKFRRLIDNVHERASREKKGTQII